MAALRKPEAQTSDQGDWAAQKFVWIPDEREGFAAAKKKSESGDVAVCVKEDSKAEVQVNKDDIQLMNPPKFNKSEDMAALTNLNEASVLFNIKDRYYANLIYTFSGLFCVVVNPYKQLPIYTDQVIQAYKGQKRDNVPPHVYVIADEAYRHMVQEGEDQSILCTGESGAGKTENTKKIIQYLTSVASSGRKHGEKSTGRRQSIVAMLARTEQTLAKGELEEQLLQANPILETFGNASTNKNDNSSRFGKFIRIQFDNAGYIVGANIDVYLLEKSRAVRQNEGERNFHSFYQLLRGADAKTAGELLLEGLTKYRFLSNGDAKLPNVDDGREYAATNKSLEIMGLSEAETKSVWKTVSAVLYFGQIEVENERRQEQAFLKSDEAAQKLCHLLGIPFADFQRGLLRPKMDIRGGVGDSVARAQSKDQVVFALEALAKGLYERLFLWLVLKINQALNNGARDTKSFIGLLDIAGFEIFKTNSFEQLCINFTNEKLQQLFNHKMFVLEQEEYVKEKIEWTFIDFGLDLQPTIDLIEQNPGILALLDDQSIMSQSATDQSILDQFCQKLKDHPKFAKSGLRQDGDFSIQHYAGRVPYTIAGWLVKNKDPLNNNITALLEKSSDPFVERLWRSDGSLVPVASNLRARGAMRTVGHIYKDQLAQLMFTLNSTNPHFVRCIIPNHVKRPGQIDSPLVLDQLRCNGVLEGIRICRQGYPNRVLFQEFRQRYQILTPGALPAGFIEGRKAAELMIKSLGLASSQFSIGETKIFFRAGVLHELEERRDLKLSKILVGLQAHCRGFLARRSLRRINPDVVKVIQRNVRTFMRIRSWAWWRLYTKIKPIISTMSADQKLRDLQALVDQLTKQHEIDEKRIRELEESNKGLEDDKRRLLEQLKGAEDALVEAEDKIIRTTTRKNEMEEEVKKLEEELEEQLAAAQKMLVERQEASKEITTLKESLKASDAAEARMNQLTAEIKDWKSKFDGSVAELHASSEQVKKLQKDVLSLQEQLDAASAAKSRAEKARQKVQSELEDANVQLSNERQASASLQSKQKVHDKQVAELRQLQDKSAAELDHSQAELREAQTRILVQRNELADLEQRAQTAEAAKKRLEAELEEMISAQNDRNMADLERLKRELQVQVDEQKKQIVELEDELQLANDAKMRAEVNNATLKEELRLSRESAADSAAVEALEAKIKGLQRQVTELQEDADSERRMRGKLSNEKRKLELDMTSIQDQLEEERKQREREQRLRESAEARLREFTAGQAGGVLQASDVRELERLRQRVRQSKTETDELEVQLANTSSAKRRAERELDEQRELVTTYEKEITQLRGQLRRIMTSLNSGEHGPVSMHWTTTSTVRSGTGEVSSHSESGSGVPPGLGDH